MVAIMFLSWRTLERLAYTTAITCLILAGGVYGKSHKRKTSDNQQSTFAYYLLALSYAPDFCSEPQGVKDPRECGSGRHIGFVVHGLWPQGENGRGPEKCGNSSPVSQSIVQLMLKYIPTESLIQHEWATHGTCSGLNAADYFAAVRKARDSVSLPNELNQPAQKLQLSPAQIEAKLAAANPTFPPGAFRTSCYADAELQEVRVCFNKDLSPRACTSSAGECSRATLTILPVR
jgi:ribonuclease T2